ncbi:unnamed protein product [Clonostachys rhizophaga]|uniref:Phosphoglycerate mutase n=1 Tax=Clonostachys rhizophaga TaxID=160324 RepID=A0A9N9YE14_9HYPO|nr:unnamed protein product [Clonostachys rhizophaga]
MAGLPSHIFVVRHGNRLDAADKKWHLSSPTPYDPPLTYNGFQQARSVGNQIASILEQAKQDAESPSANPTGRRKRFRVVIHSSPFLRCVQTSVGISSGLAQTAPGSTLSPPELILPRAPPPGKTDTPFRSSILRLDAFLGEWLSPEYFENITPPPGSSLMIGSAKADLLKREDYSIYTETPINDPPPQPRKSSLWSASPIQNSGSDEISGSSSPSQPVDDKNTYKPLRPAYAVSNAGPIPHGFVAHARDECVSVDYQWDSSRPPLDFGDGGDLPEEWTTMHRRFRGGLKRMINWYATAEAPAELVSVPVHSTTSPSNGVSNASNEDIETVVIIVSHGAGCNALIGAITHQPVLMDVGIASITMAARKPDLDYPKLLQETQAQDHRGKPLVHIDYMYDIRISASTEHLLSSSSGSPRVGSMNGGWNNNGRGRTSTLGSTPGPALGSITFNDSFSGGVGAGHRSSSASATFGVLKRRDSGSQRPGARSSLASTGLFSGPGASSGASGRQSPGGGLWRPAPAPSSLRLMDDGTNDANQDDDDDGFPNFDQVRLNSKLASSPPQGEPRDAYEAIEEDDEATGPILAAPIKLQTSWALDLEQENKHKPIEMTKSPLGDGLGDLWGLPQPPEEAERLRDLSFTKRRWTVNEKAV